MQENSSNRLLSELMQQSKLEMPFSDFEETTMHRIEQTMVQEVTVSRDRKLSFVFFVLGTCLGLVLNTILQRSEYSFLTLSTGTIVLVFQTGFILLFLIQLDKHSTLIKQWLRRRQV